MHPGVTCSPGKQQIHMMSTVIHQTTIFKQKRLLSGPVLMFMCLLLVDSVMDRGHIGQTDWSAAMELRMKQTSDVSSSSRSVGSGFFSFLDDFKDDNCN